MKNKFVKRSSAFIVGMALSVSMVCAPSAGIFGNIAPDTAIVASAASTASHLGNKSIPSCNEGKLDFKCIDVSVYQEDINWQDVKDSGIDYAIIRCGISKWGKKDEDVAFRDNYRNAKAAGVKVGLYFFSDATNWDEGADEARFVINLLKDEKKPDLPIYIDYEAGNGENTRIDALCNNGFDWNTDACRGFCETIKKAGYKAGVYSNRGSFENRNNHIWLSGWHYWLADQGYSVWMASRDYNPPSELLDDLGDDETTGKTVWNPGGYDVWQYSATGHIAGIKPWINVDLNIYYRDLDAPKCFGVKMVGANRCFTWKAVDYAEKYEVYRDDKLVATVKGTSYNETAPIVTGNETAKKKNSYYVKAVAKNSKNQTVRSAASSTLKNVDAHVSVDAISDLKCTYNSNATKATLSWSGSTRENLYRVLKYNEAKKKWETYKDVTGTKVTVNTTSAATKYCVKPCYKSGSKVLCGTGSNRVVVSNLSVKNPSVSYTGIYLRNTGAKFSWSAVDGCTYDVEIVSPDGSTKSVPVTAGHSKTISFEQTGIYKVRVRAVNGKAHGKWSGYTEVVAHAISPTSIRVTGAVPGSDNTKGVATCTWMASKLADGYIILCKNETTGDIQEIKIESPDETTCTFDVDAGCKYTVTAYSYGIINGVEEKSIVPTTTNYTAPAVFE